MEVVEGTVSEPGVRGLKPRAEIGVCIVTFHKLAPKLPTLFFSWVPRCPSPILYWDPKKKKK